MDSHTSLETRSRASTTYIIILHRTITNHPILRLKMDLLIPQNTLNTLAHLYLTYHMRDGYNIETRTTTGSKAM